MAHNIELPRFAAASGGMDGGNWGDVDNLDVDMLAEYLLDDGSLNASGVTFDFNLDASGHVNSTMVSPENSEDGILPPVADSNQKPGTSQQQQQAADTITSQSTAPQATSLPSVPPMATIATFPALSAPQQLQGHIAVGATAPAPALFQQQSGAASSAPKRRRVEGLSAAALMAAAPNPMLNGQQLAAAAAEAMQNQGRGRKKSQAQVDRRRERNRILARRTRLRKKFFFESLQKEVMDLQLENKKLKELVKSNVPGEAGRQILAECDASEKMPPGVLEACGETADMESQDFNLVKSIQRSQHSFIITDPSLTDNPIVFASDDFLKLTGYSREQVLGRNCRFLQGTETSKESVDAIRKALAVGDDASITLINYTADGTPFWNKLFIAALRDAQNNIVNFIGVVVKVANPEPGHPDHNKALPAIKTDKAAPAAESTIMAIEDSVSAAVAAAGGQ